MQYIVRNMSKMMHKQQHVCFYQSSDEILIQSIFLVRGLGQVYHLLNADLHSVSLILISSSHQMGSVIVQHDKTAKSKELHLPSINL